MKEFVTLTQQDFADWADHLFGKDQYQITQPKRGIELVIRKDLGVHGLELHIYTTVVPASDRSRGCGEDAIRIMLYDRFAGRIVSMESKVLRVVGDTTVQQRCSLRIAELMKLVAEMQEKDLFCKKCGSERAHLEEKKNSKTGETFWGCATFPRCNNPVLKAEYVRSQYPLKFNPFQELVASYVPEEIKAELMVRIKEVKEVQAAQPVKHEPKTFPISDEDQCCKTELYPKMGYRFPNFNRVQSGVIESGVVKRDVNFVLGTATSSGKTICAELVIAEILGVLS